MPDSPDSPWRGLPTEARHPESTRLDRLGSEAIVDLLLAEDQRGLEATRRHGRDIARAADLVAETLAGGGTLLVAGAGTSGRLGVLEAAECPPTFGVAPETIRAAMAGGDDAVFRASEGAEDRAGDGRTAVADLGSRDMVLAISASSVTAFARGALEQARSQGARTALLTCAGEAQLGELSAIADLVVALDTGPEILTGSTRLKAGSATKAVLNAITTAAMVRLGKTFENLMVDLRPGSAKLRDRARRILEAAARVPPAEAEAVVAAAGGDLKTAIVMARLGVPADEARRRLAAAGGHVWRALDAPEAPIAPG
jgi:N-acetylmuramic acid 6-phosphate etherase